MEADADLLLWERVETTADASLRLFTDLDVVEAMKASNFNKGLCPDGFDVSILKPGDPLPPANTSTTPRSSDFSTKP